MVCSGVPGDLTHVVAISATHKAFAAIKSDGSVVTWGPADYGGDSSSVAMKLKEVVAIRGTRSVFAALRKDGTVVTWGDKFGRNASDTSAVQSELKDIVSISATLEAFAARRSDGQVIAWGDIAHGGSSSSVRSLVAESLQKSNDKLRIHCSPSSPPRFSSASSAFPPLPTSARTPQNKPAANNRL